MRHCCFPRGSYAALHLFYVAHLITSCSRGVTTVTPAAGTSGTSAAVAPAAAATRTANVSASGAKPSIIFCGLGVDKLYLRHILSDLGVDVDYGSADDCANRTRLWQYTAAVVGSTPGAPSQCVPSCDPAKAKAFAATMQSFAAAGGGVLLMPEEMNVKKQRLFSTTEAFGIKLPLDRMKETDSSRTGTIDRLGMPMALTSNISGGSPVTAGVAQINVQGPKAREVMAAVTSADMSDTAFPFRAAKTIDVGCAELTCCRIT